MITERRFPSGRLEVEGTLKEIEAYFKARGGEIVPTNSDFMRDASEMDLYFDGRYHTTFTLYWRSRTVRVQYRPADADPGDEAQ